MSELLILIGANGTIPLLTLTLTTNADPKQASLQTTSRPHHHATPEQKNYCMQNVFVSIPICEIKIKKSGIGHQIVKVCIRQALLKNNNKIEIKEIY